MVALSLGAGVQSSRLLLTRRYRTEADNNAFRLPYSDGMRQPTDAGEPYEFKISRVRAENRERRNDKR